MVQLCFEHGPCDMMGTSTRGSQRTSSLSRVLELPLPAPYMQLSLCNIMYGMYVYDRSMLLQMRGL